MNEKQIKEKTNQFLTTIRQYIIGLQPAHMVKNNFNCLYIDLYLDAKKKGVNPHDKLKADFDVLWNEMNDSPTKKQIEDKLLELETVASCEDVSTRLRKRLKERIKVLKWVLGVNE